MSIKKETYSQIIKALESKSTIARMSALKAVASMKTRGGIDNGVPIDPILDCLHHEDADLRCDTARTLGKIKEAKAVQPLIDSLEKDSESDVRIMATESLGMIGSPKAVDTLITALLAEETEMPIDDDDEFDWDPQWDIQLHAARALGRIKDPKSIDPLVKLLKEEEAIDISDTIIWALSQIPDDRSMQIIIELLKDNNPILRRRAAKVLGNMDRPEAAKALMEALLDQDANVRINAARALSIKGDPSILVALVLLLKDPVGEVKSGVAKIISEMGHPQTADHIMPLLDDEDVDVIGQAIEILGDLKESRAAEKMIELLADPALTHKHKIATALSKIKNLDSLKPLADLARNRKEDSLARTEAINAVAEIAGDLTLEVLQDCALDSERVIYCAACIALIKVDTVEALAVLTSMLEEKEEEEEEKTEGEKEAGEETEQPESSEKEAASDEHQDEDKDENEDEEEVTTEEDDLELERKKFIVSILGSTTNAKAVDALYSIVENDVEALKTAALESLAHMKEKKAIPHLLPLLKSENRDDRLLGLASLGRIGHPDESAVEEITKLLSEEKDNYVRQMAANALGDMGASDAVEALLNSLEDPYQEVRKSVVTALGKLGDGRAREKVFSSLFDYENFAHIRNDIAIALKKIDQDQTEEQLVSVLEDDSQLVNHWIAIEALTEFIPDEG